MNTYVDKIMSNHVFNSESSEDLYYLYSEKKCTDGFGQSGGQRDQSDQPDDRDAGDAGDNLVPHDMPSGGFPPIFIINAKDRATEQAKNRQLTGKKVGISIKDILKSKK